MEFILLSLAIMTFLGWAGAGILVLHGTRQIRLLKDLPPADEATCPSLSIIIPARNEERHVEPALLSLLRQDYPNLEIIVLNDRSTDKTGQLLDRLAQSHSRLRVIDLHSVPEGWLGKNYALYQGAQEANGEYLLFTDADIYMHPQTLQKAVGYARERQLDHLTMVPGDTMPGFFLRVVAATFGLFMYVLFQPWKMRNPKSWQYMGVGAFNLVRAQVYRRVNGHQPIAMRPDDDMKLGKLLKKHGARQDILIGNGMISVEWYASVGELIAGLMKNTFAGFEYRLSWVVLGTVASLLFHLWPFVGVWLTTGWIQLGNGAVIAVILGVFWSTMAPYGLKSWHGLFFPAALLLLLYIQWKATLVTLWTGGITWRGTWYPLAKLKANKV